MGSTISALKETMTDPEQERLANDAFNCLVQVAQCRMHHFYERVSSPAFDSGIVPISKVIHKYQFFQCGVTNDSGEASKAITENLGAFVSGDVAKGVNDIIVGNLTKLLGSYAGNTSATTTYALTTGELGGLCRIDADFYSYEFTSRSLSSIAKNVVVCSIVISSANFERFTYNDFTTIVQAIYGASDVQIQRRIRDQLWEQISGQVIVPKGPSKIFEVAETTPVLAAPNPVETVDAEEIFEGTENYDVAELETTCSEPDVIPVEPKPIEIEPTPTYVEPKQTYVEPEAIYVEPKPTYVEPEIIPEKVEIPYTEPVEKPSTLYFTVSRSEFINGADRSRSVRFSNSSNRSDVAHKDFAESLKAFLVGWLVAYMRTLRWKSEKRLEVDITYTYGSGTEEEVTFGIWLENIDSIDSALEVIKQETEEGLRYIKSHPNIDPIAGTFTSWRFHDRVPVTIQAPYSPPAIDSVPVIPEPAPVRPVDLPFTRAEVGAVLKGLNVSGPVSCGQELLSLVIERSNGFQNKGAMRKMREFALAFGDAFAGEGANTTKPRLQAVYAVLRMVIAGVNYYIDNGDKTYGRQQLKRPPSLGLYWPSFATSDKMRDETNILVNTAMPLPYTGNGALPFGDGAVYMLGSLFADGLLDKELLAGNYDDVYANLVDYSRQGNHPEYCLELISRLVEGNPLDL